MSTTLFTEQWDLPSQKKTPHYVSKYLCTLTSEIYLETNWPSFLTFFNGFWAAAPTEDKVLKNGEKFRIPVRTSSQTGPQAALAGPQAPMVGPQAPLTSPWAPLAGPQAPLAGRSGRHSDPSHRPSDPSARPSDPYNWPLYPFDRQSDRRNFSPF